MAARVRVDLSRVRSGLGYHVRDANCGLYSRDGAEGTIARLDAGECMRSMTEATRSKNSNGLGHPVHAGNGALARRR